MGEKKVQVQVSPEDKEYVKKVLKDVLYYLEGWCACSESALFSRAVNVLKEFGLFEEFKERYGLPKTLYGIKSFLYDFLEFMKEKMPEIVEEVEEEVYSEDEYDEDGGEEGEEGEDVDVEVLETIKRGISEFSKRLIEKASQYSEFRTDMVKTAIALSLGKYRLVNPEELKGVKKDDIKTILFTYNCFNGVKAIIKTKDNRDKILEIRIVEDEEVKKLTELMKTQYGVLKKRFNERLEEKEKELKKKEEELKEVKRTTINHLIEKDDIEGLKKLLFFHGDIEDIKYTLEKAKEEGKDMYWLAKKIASVIEPELVAYALYSIDKEKAEELLMDYNIDPEEFKKEFELS